MTVVPLRLPCMEVEGAGLAKLALLSRAALAIPDRLEASLNRPGDDLQMALTAVSVMTLIGELLDVIEDKSSQLVDSMDPGGTALFELECALSRVHVLAFARVRQARVFINDFLVVRDGEEILPRIVA